MNEELKQNLMREIDEVWNKGNLAMLDDYYTPDFIYHLPPYLTIEGLDGYKRYIADVRKSYPDLHLTVDEVLIQEETGAFRWTFKGTQTGESPTLGIPPTRKKVTFTGCAFFHTADGKNIETWNHSDFAGLLKQLGFEMVPPSEVELV